MERPDFVRHWTELEGPDDSRYPGDDELFSIGCSATIWMRTAVNQDEKNPTAM
jgi:hypothetical protein